MRLHQIVGITAICSFGLFSHGAGASDLNLFVNDFKDTRLLGVNDTGQAIGSFEGHNYLFEAGKSIDLQNFNPVQLNNNGQILGLVKNGDSWRNAIWSEGTVTLLPELTPSGTRYMLSAINDSGTAAGVAYGLSSPQAIKYENGAFITIGSGAVFSMNNSGVAVGTSSVDDGGGDALVWRNGIQIDITRQNRYGSSYVNSFISNSGQVIGVDDLGAYIWDNGVYTDLPSEPDPHTISSSMSVRGEWIYKGGSAINVNSALESPYDAEIVDIRFITDGGFMLARDGDGNNVILSPFAVHYALPQSIPDAPEPETYAMLLAGLGLVGFAARRKSMAA